MGQNSDHNRGCVWVRAGRDLLLSVLGVELHDAATEVVVAAAIWGVAVIAAATAMTLSMPATTEVAMPVAVNRKSRP